MNWYYVSAGQRLGPVDDAQIDALVRAGQIQADTLVWYEGMANWLPYGQVRPAPPLGTVPPPPMPPPSAAAPGPGGTQVVCAECGRTFPIESTMLYGTTRVCAGCKPVFMQRLAEGATPQTLPTSFHYAGFWIRVG